MSENRTLTAVWIILILMVGASYFISESSGPFAKFIILGIAFVKFSSIGYFFMETRHYHIFWRMLILGFISLYVLVSFI